MVVAVDFGLPITPYGHCTLRMGILPHLVNTSNEVLHRFCIHFSFHKKYIMIYFGQFCLSMLVLYEAMFIHKVINNCLCRKYK